MQYAFARLLAEETNNPGSYSRVTVDTLAKMEPRHAHLMRNLRSRSAVQLAIGGHSLVPLADSPYVPLVFEVEDLIYNEMDIRFDTLDELQSFGLISYNVLGLHFTGATKRVFQLPSHIFLVTPKQEDNPQVKVGQVNLTSVGQQIFGLCGVVKSDKFADYVADQWREQGCEVSILNA